MLCFRIFLVAKKFIKKKGEGDYLNFPSKIFCLTVREHFVEEPFCAVFQIISGCEKVYGKEAGRGLSKLSVEKFLSHSTETLVDEPFSAVFQKIAGSEKV